MVELLFVLSLIFFHILDDYCLQSHCLCDLKQKRWWKENAPDKKYENDYKIGLLAHSFSWSFMIHIPVVIYLIYYNQFYTDVTFMFFFTFITNMYIHYAIDDMKANKGYLNLIQDQTFHFIQLVLLYAIYVCSTYIILQNSL